MAASDPSPARHGSRISSAAPALELPRRQIVASLLSLAREVQCAGELEATPPGGRQLEDMAAKFQTLRHQLAKSQAGGRAERDVLRGLAVDLGNVLATLRCERMLSELAASRGGAAEAAQHDASFRESFGDMLALLVTAERWLSATE